jgi:glycerol-3-phosphate O-acyltransferase
MITVFDAMKRPGYLIARLLCFLFIKPFIRVTPLPQPLALDVAKPCLLVLPNVYASDELAVKSCAKQLEIAKYDIFFLPKPGKDRANRHFAEAVDQVLAETPDTQVVSISVYWGRAPRKVGSVSQAYLADSWEAPGFFRRSLMVLLQVRQVSCYFGQAIELEPLPSLADESTPEQQQAFFQARQQFFSEQFRRQREAVIGPDLSHRRILEHQVLQSPGVLECIDQLAAETDKSTRSLQTTARKYLHEMAADYSYSVVRLLDLFLGWVWEKLYQGVNVNGMENVLEVAEDKQLIYVPCHRSHIDYLLLSYVIHQKGLMPPHIAAGINLNMPVVGSLLRRGGAFFIRREFRDNKLYRAVLESYIATMCQRGFPIEYFIEGGRSRTGLQLPHKAGMLAMTMRAAQDQKHRPLAFVPVYIGYERLLESHSYIKELYGEKKQKESLLDLFSARRYLKENYGRVNLSLGKAILADDIWRQMGVTESPRPSEGDAFFACIETLGQAIQTAVNNNASISSLNLIATALLGSNRNALVKRQLLQQIDLLEALIKVPVYQHSIYYDRCSHAEAIDRALELDLIQHNDHTLGDIYYLDQRAQIGATFLRNNSLHVFILPALVASIIINTEKTSFRRIHTICYRLYPYLKAEFYLPWEPAEIEAVIASILATLQQQGLIENSNSLYRRHSPESEQFYALLVLSGACKASMERFYITAKLVLSREGGYYDRASLEADCVKMAESLSVLHEFHAPDFFDKNLFRTFIASLVREGMFTEDEEGKLHYGRSFINTRKFNKYVLSPSVQRSISQITRSEL